MWEQVCQQSNPRGLISPSSCLHTLRDSANGSTSQYKDKGYKIVFVGIFVYSVPFPLQKRSWSTRGLILAKGSCLLSLPLPLPTTVAAPPFVVARHGDRTEAWLHRGTNKGGLIQKHNLFLRFDFSEEHTPYHVNFAEIWDHVRKYDLQCLRLKKNDPWKRTMFFVSTKTMRYFFGGLIWSVRRQNQLPTIPPPRWLQQFAFMSR